MRGWESITFGEEVFMKERNRQLIRGVMLTWSWRVFFWSEVRCWTWSGIVLF